MTFLISKAFWAALMMGCLCPLIGRNLVLGRSIMLGLALPQVSLAGIAFVILGAAHGWAWCAPFQDDSSRAFLGAAIFTLPVLLLLAGRKRLAEASLAFVFLGAVSVTNLLLASDAVGQTFIHDLFHGRLLMISDESLAFLALVLGVSAAVAFLFRRRILLILLDADFTRASGASVRRWELTVALLNGAVISVAVATVGPVVTFGFLVLPVLCAALFAKSLHWHLVLGVASGAVMATVGSWASYQYDLPLGDAVVAIGCAGLILCWVARGAWARATR
jgi:ABC-type Mn2+/Zn2+ transport system permease subunit